MNRLGIGLTDLVKGRAAPSDALLLAGDFDVAGFVNKVVRAAPLVIAFNGKTAATVVARALRQRAQTLGPAAWAIGASKVFTVPSSSSAACDPRTWAPCSSKCDWWRELADFVDITARSAG